MPPPPAPPCAFIAICGPGAASRNFAVFAPPICACISAALGVAFHLQQPRIASLGAKHDLPRRPPALPRATAPKTPYRPAAPPSRPARRPRKIVAFSARDRRFRAHQPEMRAVDTGDDRHIRPHQPRQRRNLARMVHADLEHREIRVARHPRQRQRHADMVVETRLGRMHARQTRPSTARSISLVVVLPTLPVTATIFARGSAPAQAAASRVSPASVSSTTRTPCPGIGLRDQRRRPPPWRTPRRQNHAHRARPAARRTNPPAPGCAYRC